MKMLFQIHIFLFFIFVHGLCTDEKKKIAQILLNQNAKDGEQQKSDGKQNKSEESAQKRQIDNTKIKSDNDLNQKKQKAANKNDKSQGNSEANTSSANEMGSQSQIRFAQNFFTETNDFKTFDEIIMKNFNRSKPIEPKNEPSNDEAKPIKAQIIGQVKKDVKIQENSKILTPNEPKKEQLKEKRANDDDDQQQQQKQSVENRTPQIEQATTKDAINEAKANRMIQRFLTQRSNRWKSTGKFLIKALAPIQRDLHHFKGAEKRKMEEEIKKTKLMILFASRCIDSALISIELSLLPVTVDLSPKFNHIYYIEQNEIVSVKIARQILCAALIEPIAAQNYLHFYIEQLKMKLPENLLLVAPNNPSIKAKEYLQGLEAHLADITSSTNSEKNLKVFYNLYKTVKNVLDKIRMDFDGSEEIGNILYKTKTFVAIVMEEMRQFVRKASEIGLMRAKSEKCDG